MSNGKVHALTTTIAAGTIGPALIMLGGVPLDKTAAFISGCLLGLIVNPDLDVDRGSKANAILRRSAGCLASAAWHLFWLPYARLIPHRSPLSHAPFLGTLLRLAYLSAIPVLAWHALSMYFPLPPLHLSPPSLIWLWVFCGLATVDILHIALDRL